jgi:hypothetical protein
MASIVSLPSWAREACRIKEWLDVERLEGLLIADKPDDSFLKKVFLIDKAKLRECLDQIAKVRDLGGQQASLTDSISIQPSETISFSFRYRSPHLYRPRVFDTQVKVSYKDPSLATSGTYSLGETISFNPPISPSR